MFWTGFSFSVRLGNIPVSTQHNDLFRESAARALFADATKCYLRQY